MVWRLGVKLPKPTYIYLQKILLLQKRVLRLMYFSEHRAHAVPLFISAKILLLQMLYAEKVSSIMFDFSSCMNRSVISSLKIIQSRRMRPGFFRAEIIMSKLQD